MFVVCQGVSEFELLSRVRLNSACEAAPREKHATTPPKMNQFSVKKNSIK